MILCMTQEGMEITAQSEPKTFQEAVVKHIVEVEFQKQRDEQTKLQQQLGEELSERLQGKTISLSNF